jgi:hypothetical protein
MDASGVATAVWCTITDLSAISDNQMVANRFK